MREIWWMRFGKPAFKTVVERESEQKQEGLEQKREELSRTGRIGAEERGIEQNRKD